MSTIIFVRSYLIGRTRMGESLIPRSTSRRAQASKLIRRRRARTPLTTYRSPLLLAGQWLAGEVVEAGCEQREHHYAHPVTVQRVARAEMEELPVSAVLLGEALQQARANAQQPYDSARCDQPRGIETARRDIALARKRNWIGHPIGARALLDHRAVDHPSHHATDEDGQRGGDRKISSNRECERPDAQQLDDYDQRHAQQNQRPRQLAREDAIDDGRHQAALRRGGALAADSLNPLHLNLSGGWVEKILPIVQRGRADRVEQDVLPRSGELLLGVVVGVMRGERDAVAREVAFVLHAMGKVGERERDRLLHSLELLQAYVHRV